MDHKSKSLGHLNSILYRHGQSYLAKELQPYGIGSGQHSFLLFLFNQDGTSQEFISNTLNIDKATTARAIKKLEECGYVWRQIDPDDKRVNKVFITPKAQEVKAVLHKASAQWTDILTKGFTDEEKEISIKLLTKMSHNASLFVKSK